MYHMSAVDEGRVPLFIGMGEELDFRFDDLIAALARVRLEKPA